MNCQSAFEPEVSRAFAELSVYRSQILPTVIPEPATLSLLALGGLAALRRRHRSVSRTEKKGS